MINKSTHLSGWLVFTSLCHSHWHVILTVPRAMFGVFLLKLKGIFAVSHNIWCAGAETDHNCNSKEEFIAVGELGEGELNEVMPQLDMNLIWVALLVVLRCKVCRQKASRIDAALLRWITLTVLWWTHFAVMSRLLSSLSVLKNWFWSHWLQLVGWD